jgi:hypothetical protein
MPWTRMDEWRYSSTILDLGTRWRRVVSFTPRPLYPRGNRPRYPLYRRLGGPQSRSERHGEEKNLASAGNRTPAVQPVAIPILILMRRVFLLCLFSTSSIRRSVVCQKITNVSVEPTASIFRVRRVLWEWKKCYGYREGKVASVLN